MTKKMKKMVSMDPSPSYTFDEEAKTRLKHQNLMQDYNELQKETEAMKKKLQRIKKKKLTLLAEVRFLKRRYKYLVNNPSEKTRSESLIQPQNHEIRIENSVKERIYKEKQASKPIFSPVFDLNQKGEETEEVQVAWEPLRIEKKSKRPPIEGNAIENDLNLSICRDVENGSNRARKRKITWQDQVALRV